MLYKKQQIKLPPNYTEDELRRQLEKKLNIKDFTYQIEKKSLDARKKNDIHWLLNIAVFSQSIKGDEHIPMPKLEIRTQKRGEQIIVIGSGPAGFFSAYVLQLAGYKVTIIERGSDVEQRTEAITRLNRSGQFSPSNNYAFGEGGAGTFSDGKLTSRSKRITAERNFILTEYVKAGAPQEILYMAHPHIGTDNLKIIAANLRKKFLSIGGTILFDTLITDITVKKRRIRSLLCSNREIEADYFIFASGNSAYDTYRMLINRGVPFSVKNFAIGHRIEHPQKLINRAQWGRETIQGVKAAEYRLTAKTSTGLPVYSFCMCPGGQVVPAAAYEHKSVVNGMSRYQRDGRYANAGIVVGVHPDKLLGHKAGALEILDWIDKMEDQFYDFKQNYTLPAAMAKDYIRRRGSNNLKACSYSLGIQPAPLHTMLPEFIAASLAEGLKIFARKLRGFETGQLMGFESKTSSPLQAVRESSGKSAAFDNLYIVGEGSGYAGGIISSAADGIKAAISLIEK